MTDTGRLNEEDEVSLKLLLQYWSAGSTFNDLTVTEQAILGSKERWQTIIHWACEGDKNPYNSETSGPQHVVAHNYRIVRSFYDEDKESYIVKQSMTLAEAQAWCKDEKTKGDGWFDEYEGYKRKRR